MRVSTRGGCVAWGAWCQWLWGAWVLVPSPHHVLLLCCLLQGLQKWQKLWIGLPVALRECHGVVVWYYDVDMAADEDLDEEE